MLVIRDSLFFLMLRRQPRSKRTDTLCPYATLCRSQAERSSRRVVAWIAGFRSLPGRKTRLQWVSLIARATSSSKAQIRTGSPLAAATWAKAVPHAPAPITPILMLSPPRHAPFLHPDRAASGAAPPHPAHPSIRQQTALRLPSLSWRRYPCIARVAVRQRVGQIGRAHV